MICCKIKKMKKQSHMKPSDTLIKPLLKRGGGIYIRVKKLMVEIGLWVKWAGSDIIFGGWMWHGKKKKKKKSYHHQYTPCLTRRTSLTPPLTCLHIHPFSLYINPYTYLSDRQWPPLAPPSQRHLCRQQQTTQDVMSERAWHSVTQLQ